MKITLELGDTGETVDLDLPTVPRIGEQILWADETTDDQGTWERLRDYRVHMVHWSLSPKPMGQPFILLRLDPLPDEDTGTEAPSARDELWDALGIDPDRISREEFDEYLNAYDQAASAGPVRPDEEPTRLKETRDIP